MSGLLYKGKDIERMSRDELIHCVKELFQKLKDKHFIIEGMKMMSGKNGQDDRYGQFMDALNNALSKKK